MLRPVTSHALALLVQPLPLAFCRADPAALIATRTHGLILGQPVSGHYLSIRVTVLAQSGPPALDDQISAEAALCATHPPTLPLRPGMEGAWGGTALRYGGIERVVPLAVCRIVRNLWNCQKRFRTRPDLSVSARLHGCPATANAPESVRGYEHWPSLGDLVFLGQPMIAALFVQKDGCYYGLPDVDPWPEDRDARKYVGPHPVVAHPPCQLWGRFAHLNYARWGKEKNRPGNDGGCFASALYSVCNHGGVLEHPAFSDAWKTYKLMAPRGMGWLNVGARHGKWEWVCEVWQSAYGHRARKRTWLYYCGTTRPVELNWDRPAGTHWIGHYDRKNPDKYGKHKPGLGKKEASATPIKFRDALINLAKGSMVCQTPL